MNEIRVPSKVLKVWEDGGMLWCALEDGRVYRSEDLGDLAYKWVLAIPAMEDR